MDADEYQHLALRTSPEPSRDARLVNAALGLSGEAGEFADDLKKHLFHGHSLDRAHLAEELGDILWYAALAADALGLRLGEVMEGNISKLRRRYPDGFTAERSINRED